MKYLLLAGLLVAGLLGAVLAWPRPADPVADYWHDKQLELAFAEQQAANARWAIFWHWAGATVLVVGSLAVVGGGLVAVDQYQQRRRPLVALGPVQVDRRRLHLGEYDYLIETTVQGAALAAIEAARNPGSTHTYSPHIIIKSEGGALPAPPVVPALPAPVPTFAELLTRGDIAPGRPLLLGYTHAGPLTGALKDWRSGAIAGLPGSGKTTTQRFIAAQAALQGARLVVLDPHADAGPDSLAGTLAPLAPAFLCEPASTPAAMRQALHLVVDLMERRLAGGPVDFPVFAFVDEFTALMLRDDLGPDLAKLLESITLQGRKTLTQACIAGQSWGATRAGSTSLRDNLAATYAHRMRPNACRVLGLPLEDARRVPGLATGTAVLWRADGTIADVTIPWTTGADVAAVGALLAPGRAPGGPHIIDAVARDAGAVLADSPWWETVVQPPRQPADSTRTAPADSTNSPTLSPEAARVVSLFLQGLDIPQIVKEVRGIDPAKGGAPYRAASAEVQAMIRQALGGSEPGAASRPEGM